MNDLGPAAREMVESHRRGRVLTHADRERIKQKLMLRVAALGATTAATGTAVGMSLASKIALVVFGVTAVVGAGSFSLWALRGRAPSDVMARQASLPIAPEIVAPAPAATPPGAIAPADSVPVDTHSDHAKKLNKRPVVMALANPSPAATPVAPLDPEPELRVVREAREDLRAGHPESAYRRLDDYGRQHSGGMLAQERKALSAIALCKWQPGPDAQTRAAEFLRNSPESPLGNRVRSACEKASKPSP
jgi:hypothetical protein